MGRFINADSYTSTGQGVLGNNMFAYCSNNPVNRFDPLGEFPLITLGFAAAGALVNVATSYIAAKVTGQSYTLSDGCVAAVTGAACAFGTTGAVVAGVLSGGYSAYSSYENGASVLGCGITGIASGLLTGFGIGNIVGLDQTLGNLGLQALLDFVFCTGYNSMSAAIYKSVILSSQTSDNKIKPNEPQAAYVVGPGVTSATRGSFHTRPQMEYAILK